MISLMFNEFIIKFIKLEESVKLLKIHINFKLN